MNLDRTPDRAGRLRVLVVVEAHQAGLDPCGKADYCLEPELMATLAQLRQELLTGIESPTAADKMVADSAVLAYRNMLRVQGWIGNLCLVVERELYGQAPLNELHGHTVGKQLTNEIVRLEEVLMPLLERCHRMMARSIAHLDSRRRKPTTTSVTVGQAGQVNVDCTSQTRSLVRPRRQ